MGVPLSHCLGSYLASFWTTVYLLVLPARRTETETETSMEAPMLTTLCFSVTNLENFPDCTSALARYLVLQRMRLSRETVRTTVSVHRGQMTFLPSFRDKCLPCYALPPLLQLLVNVCNQEVPTWHPSLTGVSPMIGAQPGQLIQRKLLGMGGVGQEGGRSMQAAILASLLLLINLHYLFFVFCFSFRVWFSLC